MGSLGPWQYVEPPQRATRGLLPWPTVGRHGHRTTRRTTSPCSRTSSGAGWRRSGSPARRSPPCVVRAWTRPACWSCSSTRSRTSTSSPARCSGRAAPTRPLPTRSRRSGRRPGPSPPPAGWTSGWRRHRPRWSSGPAPPCCARRWRTCSTTPPATAAPPTSRSPSAPTPTAARSTWWSPTGVRRGPGNPNGVPRWIGEPMRARRGYPLRRASGWAWHRPVPGPPVPGCRRRAFLGGSAPGRRHLGRPQPAAPARAGGWRPSGGRRQHVSTVVLLGGSGIAATRPGRPG
jgi:hypothetical protein